MAPGRWLAYGVLLFCVGLYAALTSGMISNDESWFLQVARRIASGDVLYRDVFFGVTPLSAYLAGGLVGLFGVEIVVIRVMVAGCFAATAVLALCLARQLRLSSASQALLVMAIVAYVPAWMPGIGSPYTPLAYVFLLACLAATLAWLAHARSESAPPSRSIHWLLAAGGFAGLAFASKQTIGGYALAALWVAILGRSPLEGHEPRGKLKDLVTASLAFGTITVMTLLPVWASRGFGKFLEYGFLNRGEYVAAASISYWVHLRDWLHLLVQLKPPPDVLFAYWELQLLLPIATFPALGVAWFRCGPVKRSTALTLFSFSAAAFAGAFPRVDLPHMAPAVTPLAIALFWSMEQIATLPKRPLDQAARILIAIWLGLGVVAQLARPLRWMALGTHSLSPLPHFHGVLLPRDVSAALLSHSQVITSIPPDETLFFLSPSASLLYLLCDRADPTPYDYPLVTAFGREGQWNVIDEIIRGRVQWVCLTPLGADPLSPSVLEAYVQEHMQPSRDAGACKLYLRSP